MTDLRDKLAQIVFNHWSPHGPTDNATADAIIAAMPDMVPELVWEGFESGPYEIIIDDTGIADLLCHAVHDEDWNPDTITGGYLTLVSVDDLKAAANAHHREQVMQALGL